MATQAEKAQRQIQVGLLTQQGLSAVEIADRLGVDARTVQRDRTEIGVTGASDEATHRRTERRRPPCGTPGGYEAHLHRGERTCTACRRAHNNQMGAYIAGRRGFRTVKISCELLAELYRAADPDVQKRARNELGDRLTRALNSTAGQVVA